VKIKEGMGKGSGELRREGKEGEEEKGEKGRESCAPIEVVKSQRLRPLNIIIIII